jgi:hypothetical protein
VCDTEEKLSVDLEIVVELESYRKVNFGTSVELPRAWQGFETFTCRFFQTFNSYQIRVDFVQMNNQ